MNAIWLLPTGLACLVGGVAIGSYLALPSAPPPPVSISDMRAIVAALEPYESSQSWRRASVCVQSRPKSSYADQATVVIRFHTKRDSEFEGKGDDIPSAIQDLTSGADMIKGVLAPFSGKTGDK